MASIKTDVKNNSRATLNTTVDKETFEEFKRASKLSGIPMNVLLETFMRQYNAGGFYLKFDRNTKKVDLDVAD